MTWEAPLGNKNSEVTSGPLAQLTQPALDGIRDPRFSLPAYGRIFHQSERRILPYNATAISRQLAAVMLDWIANPPKNEDGHTLWVNFLGPRQVGKSANAEVGFYPKVATTPGYSHVCIADTKPRAKALHLRLHQMDSAWPKELKGQRVPSYEKNQITFRVDQGGSATILSANDAGGAGGIGLSLDSLHPSECAFWPDFSGTMSLIHPALINVPSALVVCECTPAPNDRRAPSADAWREHWESGLPGSSVYETSRYRSLFFPMWDGKLNRRAWRKDWSLENHEIRLLEKYGPRGLTKENIAFYRIIRATDEEIRADPELAYTYYPLDAVTCWKAVVGGVFGNAHLDALKSQVLVPWQGPLMVYEEYEADAPYIVAVDPTGEAARDHGAVAVQKHWAEDITTVAMYADHTPPQELAVITCSLSDKYGKAPIAVESNGVGQGIIAYIIAMGYGNRLIRLRGRKEHGIPSSQKYLHDSISMLKTEVLEGRFFVRDEDLVRQLGTYRNDKMIEFTPKQEQLASTRRGPKRRRERHHWDKVSATLLGVYAGRRFLPVRYRNRGIVEKPEPMSLLDFATSYAEAQEAKMPALRYVPTYKRGF